MDYLEQLTKNCDGQKSQIAPFGSSENEIPLGPDQKEAMTGLVVALQSNETNFSVVHTCGTRKIPVMGNALIASQKAKKELGVSGRKDVLIVSKIGIVRSVRQELESLGLDVGVFTAEREDLDHPVIIASIPRLKKLISKQEKSFDTHNVDLVLIDEVDSFISKYRKSVLMSFTPVVSIGFSETATRLDENDPIKIFGKKIYIPMPFKEDASKDLALSLASPTISQADKKGFFVLTTGEGDQKKEERYGSRLAWKKELKIQVHNRLTGKLGITAKDQNGRILVNGFYSESFIRNLYADLLQDVPCADENGFFILEIDEGDEKKEVRFATRKTWGKELEIDYFLIRSRLEGKEGMTGKGSNGQIVEKGFYPESLIYEVFSDRLQNLPQSDENGFIILTTGKGKYKNVERWGTKKTWQKVLKTSHGTITARFSGKEGIPGRDRSGHIRLFYPESIARYLDEKNSIENPSPEESSDVSEILPKADRDGFFIMNDDHGSPVKYGAIASWVKVLGIGATLLARRLENAPSVRGTRKGIKCKFFAESIVREACQEYLRELPKADKDGFFIVYDSQGNPVKYGLKEPLARLLGISAASVRRLVDPKLGITGKDYGGHIHENAFFAEQVVREACTAVIAKQYGKKPVQ